MDGQIAARTDETSAGVAESETRIAALLAAQKAAWASDVTPDHATRDDRLARLDRMVESWQDRFVAAISEDFGNRPAVVTTLTDIVPVRAAIRHARRNLRAWMHPQRVSLAWTGKPASAVILRQPLGVVGIVGPWNYPLNLVLSPLIGALAAGNRAMLKPSELTPAYSQALAQAIAETFAEDEVAVVTGGPDVAAAFTAAPFDHLVFTGSTNVGRKVAEAAAKNLTPVTLELGGKSPAILDLSAQFDKAVPRLVWGKLLNSGQTCVAPDYALVPRGRVQDFLAAVKAEVVRQYPGLPANADYTSIISPRHYARLIRLVEEARDKGAEVVELGGSHDPERRMFSPFALIGAPDETAVMREEIFGPILPIVPYDTLDQAIDYINQRDRPLALYWFGEDKAAQERVLTGTIAGGVTVNDTILHLAQDDLPFGGVGASGYGAYHGEAGLLALSKEKPVLKQAAILGVKLLYPPYGRVADWMLKLLGRIG